MHYSTSLNVFEETIYDGSLDKTLLRCAAAGFTRLDLNYWDYLKRILRMSAAEEEEWASRIRESADRCGIRFTQMHGPMHGRTFACLIHNFTIDSYEEQVRRSLRTAAILGVPWVVFHPTNVTGDRFEKTEEALSFNADFFGRFLPDLEKLGVGLTLENLYDNNPNDRGNRRQIGAVPEEQCELIDRIGHPLVGACWDTGHGHMQGLPQGQSIRMLGHRLKAMHVHDNDGVRDHHVLPYFGSIDWTDTMQALRDIGYTGGFTYEAHNSVRILPDTMRDSAMNLAASIARTLTE